MKNALHHQLQHAGEALTSVRDVFAALAEELERARILGLRVEGAICAIAVHSSLDDGIVSELQQLDHVIQHVAALRDFAAEVSNECDGVEAVTLERALGRIRLAEVRTRLAGASAIDPPDEEWELL